jgi:hypothetical protein
MENRKAAIFKRRKFVVHTKFQVKLMMISFGYVIFFCAFMVTFLLIPLMMKLDNSVRGSEEAFVAALRLLYLNERLWPALLISFLAIGCHSIFTSHKIAGPLYRFNRVFEAMREGIVPSPIQLRAKDYLYSEMENINQMLERFREKLTELQEGQAHLNGSIVKCIDGARHSSMNELMKEMEDLAEQGKRLEEKLGYFKVTP